MHRLRLAIARYLSITLLCTISANSSAADKVTYSYDALGRLVSATDAGQGVTYRYDAAGNLTTIAANSTPLTITALQPGSGVAGTAVTISGTGFASLADDNAVKFNGYNATVQSASSTQIVALVPPGAVSGEISVTTSVGTAVSPMDFHIDRLGPPAISGFSPAVAAPGSSVVISGANFDASAKVFFGIVSSPYRTVHTSSLTVDVPARAESGKIEVATIHGTARSSDDFFLAPPGLSPANIAVTGRLTFGLPRPVNLAVAGQKAMLLFDGTAGQKVSLQIGSSTITSASASILAPGNTTVATSSFSTAGGIVDALMLPVSGTYAVLINPSGTAVGNPAITLHTFVDVRSELVPGGSASQVATSVPGQNAVLSFNGSAGQRISTLVSGVSFNGSSYLSLTLRKPDGGIMIDSQIVTTSGAFLDTQTLPVSGTYTLQLNPQGSTLAKATVQLFDVPTDLSFTATAGGGSAQVATTVPGQNAAIVFNGVAGQRISALVNSVSFTNGGYLYLSLRKPDGGVKIDSQLVTSIGAFLDTQTLPVSGTYTLQLNPQGSTLAKATVQLYDVPTNLSATATAGGGPVQIATTVPGQNAAIAFNGVAGQRVSALVNGVSFADGNYLYMSLRKPDGGVMIDSQLVTSIGAFLDTQTLPVSGIYTLQLNPQDSTLAKATVQLFDVPTDLTFTATAGGEPVQVTKTVTGQNAAIVFNGLAGQRISALVNGVSFTNGGSLYLSLRKPDGSIMINSVYVSSSGVLLDTQTLPVSGTYTLRLDPREASQMQQASKGTVV